MFFNAYHTGDKSQIKTAKIKENTKYQYSKTPKNKTEIFAVEVFVKIVVNHEVIV